MNEKKVCRVCKEEKDLVKFRPGKLLKSGKRERKTFCRTCEQNKQDWSIEDLFNFKIEQDLIPGIKADLEFLKQKAREKGLIE